jgi:putative sugar O-methyltransferase
MSDTLNEAPMTLPTAPPPVPPVPPGADPLQPMADMVSEVRSAPPIYRPSAFWEELCATNLAMLRDHGLERFKLSLAQNYFNWLVTSPRDRQFLRVLQLWLSHPGLAPWTVCMGDIDGLWTTLSADAFTFRWRQRQVYRLFVGLLWEHMLSIDASGLGSELEEPTTGHPIPLTRRGRRISQDLANSIIEYNTVLRINQGRAPAVIAELGAGYGRLAHVFLSRPGTKRYCIVDIPPALMVSQWYLGQILPARRIFRFRHFDRAEQVWAEYLDSEIAFLTPNQLELFPERHFDLMLSISTFPEMRAEQVDHYFQLFSRLAGSHIFIKQWINWLNPKDLSHVVNESYRLPPGWACTLDERDPTMPLFFNKAWTRQ